MVHGAWRAVCGVWCVEMEMWRVEMEMEMNGNKARGNKPRGAALAINSKGISKKIHGAIFLLAARAS